MDDRQRKRQQQDIARHVPYDEMKSKKQTAKQRRAGRDKHEPRVQGFREDNWEALLDQHGPSKKRREKVDQSAPELTQPVTADGAEELDRSDYPIVIYVASGRCRVFHDGEEIDCLVPAEIAVRQKSALAVGDRVTLSHEGDIWRLGTILPRRSILARPDPLNKHLQRLIAANVDVVIHVVSLKSPPLRPRLIDRFLIAIQRGGAQPVICVNKIDLLEEAELQEELAKLSVYRDLGIPVIACSTKSGRGLDELRSEVLGKMAALVGHSGVGKSSILNAVHSALQLATNTLHRRGTGRHTTSASTLYDIGDQTYLIDTPGIREFGLWDLDRDSLRDYFPEFTEPSELCRFTNCTHVHEPNCEVKEQVEAGTLSNARYATYVRLWQDLET